MPELFARSLKPIWLLGCGAGFGLLLLLLLWGLVTLVRRPAGAAMADVLRETVVWPVLLLAGMLTLFTLVAAALDATGCRIFDKEIFAEKKMAMESILRLGFTGQQRIVTDIPGKTAAFAIPLHVPQGELNSIQFKSNRELLLTVNDPDQPGLNDDQRLHVRANDAYNWARGNEAIGPLAVAIERLFVSNDGSRPARLSIKLTTQSLVPQAAIIPITAGGLVAYVGLLLLLHWWCPKVSAVALATAREAMSQPLFYLVLAAGFVLLLALLVTPFFTFGEDVKVYKDGGLTVIMVLSIIFAVWTASVSIADEIEGRTALTVLSKPIGRIQFILGKYLGIILPVAVVFILLGTMFLMCTSYKAVYDARESGQLDIAWQDCYTQMTQVTPGLILAFMEAAVLVSISVAISTRLPLLPNLIICTSIYIMGHLVPLLVQSTLDRFELVRFMGQLLATILPNLENFNVYAAVAAGAQVPLAYLGWAGLYTMIYIAIALLGALALFEDRDLA